MCYKIISCIKFMSFKSIIIIIIIIIYKFFSIENEYKYIILKYFKSKLIILH